MPLDGPRLEQLDGHAVAVVVADPDLHRAEAEALAAEDHRAAERAGQEPQRVRGVGGGERDVVEVVPVHAADRDQGFAATGVPRPARVKRAATNQPMREDEEPADCVEHEVVRR